MQSSAIPSGIQLPFANAGAKQTIPVTSQIGIVNGRASYTDGFPPLTRTPVIAGGVPPFGTDMNGVLFAITAIQQWQTAGGSFKFDSAWSTANGGYPKGAILTNAQNDGFWISLVENNTTDPDAAANVAWAPNSSYGITTIALTNANVTLTPDQYAQPFIVLTGTLTGNVALTLPKLATTWSFINNTTGAFSVTALTAAGTPVALSRGALISLRGDGTNVLNDAIQVGTGTDPRHAVNLGQFGAILAGNGYMRFPNPANGGSGLIFQWGSATTSGGGASVTFPIAFASVFAVVASVNAANINKLVSTGTFLTTGFPAYVYQANTNVNADATFDWMATGT